MISRAALTEQSGADLLALVKVARACFAPGTAKTVRFCRGQSLQVSVWPAASKTFTARCGTAGGMHARAHTRENTHAHMHACFTDRQTVRQMQRVTQRRAHTQTRRMRACIAGMSACTCLCTYANIGISTHRIHRDHNFCQHGVIRVLKVLESPYKVPF